MTTPNENDGASGRMSRKKIAQRLRDMADLLEAQDAGPFRVRAYRRAAETVESHDQSPAEILHSSGVEGLTDLPNIGEGIASAIEEMVTTGRWSQLERIRGEADPEQLFRNIPGIGPELAQSIHEELHADSLEALEIAAHDGRLETVPGIGPRRAEAIRESLEARLSRRRRRGQSGHDEPPVSVLLEVDEDYRRQAEAGNLRRIAPRRFNPERKAWLPVMHVDREGWDMTVLFSNTARAHDLGRTRDWVVIYFSRDGGPERQRTVVTETSGPLEGRRVVRGREGD